MGQDDKKTRTDIDQNENNGFFDFGVSAYLQVLPRGRDWEASHDHCIGVEKIKKNLGQGGNGSLSRYHKLLIILGLYLEGPISHI